MILGSGLGCSLTAGQVHQTQLPGAHTPIGQIPALHNDANDEMGAGTLHIHLLGEHSKTSKKKDTEWTLDWIDFRLLISQFFS